jgi:hypothetical protein
MIVLRDFRANRQGTVWTGMLVLALLGAAAAGAYVVLYQGEGLTVEARVKDVDTGNDPIRATFELRLTNIGPENFVIEQADVTVWADGERTVLLTEGHVGGILVPGNGQPTSIDLPIEIHNAGALGSSVWVDYHASWMRGSQRQAANVMGREISVGDALSRLA